jgi:hypothetical protein
MSISLRFLAFLAVLGAASANSSELVCIKGDYPDGNFERIFIKYKETEIHEVQVNTQALTLAGNGYPCDVNPKRGDGETTWNNRGSVTEVTYLSAFVDDKSRYPKVIVTDTPSSVAVSLDVPFARFCGASAELPTRIVYYKKSRKCSFK